MENLFGTLCNLRFASEAIFKIHSKILHKYEEENNMETKKPRARLVVVLWQVGANGEVKRC